MTNEVKRELDKILGKLSGLDEMMLESNSERLKEARERKDKVEADRYYWYIDGYLDALMWHNVIEIEECTILGDWYRWHDTSRIEKLLKEKSA